MLNSLQFSSIHGSMSRGTQALRVLALASQKGGSGKTTLSGHLAVQAQRAGAGPVVLIDIDPQGSLADWWNEREAEYPAFAQTTVARLANDLAVLRQQGFKLAVIDTPPAITMAIQSVISVAELIVVPTRPSPHDLRAVGATVDLCERAGKPLVFVVNGATPKARSPRKPLSRCRSTARLPRSPCTTAPILPPR
jgi:chromosome partitioning protein